MPAHCEAQNFGPVQGLFLDETKKIVCFTVDVLMGKLTNWLELEFDSFISWDRIYDFIDEKNYLESQKWG